MQNTLKQLQEELKKAKTDLANNRNEQKTVKDNAMKSHLIKEEKELVVEIAEIESDIKQVEEILKTKKT